MYRRPSLILGDPGAVSQVGRKCATKVFELFPKIQADAGSWLGTKIAFYYCAHWQTVSPEFFLWVRTQWLILSRHTCPVCSPSLCVQGKLLFSTFLTRNKGTTDELNKRLGYYQQEQLNLPREYSVFDGSQLRGSGDEKFKWVTAWQGTTTTLHVHHAFLYISLLSTARLSVKMPNFTFCEGRKQAMTKFILFMNLDMVERNSAPEEFACIWQSKRVWIISIEYEKIWIHFSMQCFHRGIF